MKTIEEIYLKIAENIKTSIEESWDKAVLEIHVAYNFSSYKGYFYYGTERKAIKVSKFDQSIDNELIDLHTISTIRDKIVDKWNIAHFTILKDNSYNIDFIWDQNLYDSVYGKS